MRAKMVSQMGKSDLVIEGKQPPTSRTCPEHASNNKCFMAPRRRFRCRYHARNKDASLEAMNNIIDRVS